DCEEFDDVASPPVVVLVQLYLNDAQDPVADRLCLVLHPLHSQLASVVERLRVLLKLNIAPRLADRLNHPAVGNVVDAVAHDKTYRTLACLHQSPEGLTGEVAGERAPVRRAVDL